MLVVLAMLVMLVVLAGNAGRAGHAGNAGRAGHAGRACWSWQASKHEARYDRPIRMKQLNLFWQAGDAGRASLVHPRACWPP